jgi:hypothetical protein
MLLIEGLIKIERWKKRHNGKRGNRASNEPVGLVNMKHKIILAICGIIAVSIVLALAINSTNLAQTQPIKTYNLNFSQTNNSLIVYNNSTVTIHKITINTYLFPSVTLKVDIKPNSYITLSPEQPKSVIGYT